MEKKTGENSKTNRDKESSNSDRETRYRPETPGYLEVIEDNGLYSQIQDSHIQPPGQDRDDYELHHPHLSNFSH